MTINDVVSSMPVAAFVARKISTQKIKINKLLLALKTLQQQQQQQFRSAWK